MGNHVSTIFDNHFHIEEAVVDEGLLKIEEGQQFDLPKAFFNYQHTFDLSNGKEVVVVEVTVDKCVVLPGSVRNRSKIVYAGTKPIFASLDTHNNLLTYIFAGSVIRVEYLGQKGGRRKVKYFKCL